MRSMVTNSLERKPSFRTVALLVKTGPTCSQAASVGVTPHAAVGLNHSLRAGTREAPADEIGGNVVIPALTHEDVVHAVVG